MEELKPRLRGDYLDLTGQLTLKELGALVAAARLLIGVDSMPVHLASAVGTPVVVLFGPSGDVEWGPWRVPHRIVTAPFPCRPCGNKGCGDGGVARRAGRPRERRAGYSTVKLVEPNSLAPSFTLIVHLPFLDAVVLRQVRVRPWLLSLRSMVERTSSPNTNCITTFS